MPHRFIPSLASGRVAPGFLQQLKAASGDPVEVDPRHGAGALLPHQRPLPHQVPHGPLVTRGLRIQARPFGRQVRREASPIRERHVRVVVLFHRPKQGAGV